MAATIPIFTGNLFVGNLFVGNNFTVLNDPLQNALLATLLVPRTPIRIPQTGLEHPGRASQKGKNPLLKDNPQKIDPRVPRASETVQNILNGLARTGSLFKTGVDSWVIPAIPRQVTADADAFNGEVFYNTTDLALRYKTPGGAVMTFTLT